MGNKAFLSFASTNTKEVLRFAYVYQRQQQPLCDVLLKDRDNPPPQVSEQELTNQDTSATFVT